MKTKIGKCLDSVSGSWMTLECHSPLGTCAVKGGAQCRACRFYHMVECNQVEEVKSQPRVRRTDWL